jgi:hypothetical protein
MVVILWICGLSLNFDIIVVMPRRDLLNFLTFGLSAKYTYFCIENVGLNPFITYSKAYSEKLI